MKKYGKYERMPDGTRAKQPAKKSVLLQTYLTSLLCMALCITMFLGTTYAWFTSEVENNNEIYIGILDVALSKLESDGTWIDFEDETKKDEKLFDKTIHWEPGYTALETVKISDKGDLAFRYAMTFAEASAVDEAAAKWFDVWCYHDSQNTIPKPENYVQITEANGWTKVGSLSDVLAGTAVFQGEMTKEAVAADEERVYTIALHMNGEKIAENLQESLNALMGKTISLNVKLVATQFSSEEDAFDSTYDTEKVTARVTNLGKTQISYSTWIGQPTYEMTLDAAYKFEPVETYEEVQSSPFKDYIADFVVKADQDVAANTIALAGYYKLFCEGYNDNRWIAMQSSDDVPAGYEISLIRGAFQIPYELLCELGNDGIGFQCGVANLDPSNVGKTITVELRLYELDAQGQETGKFVVANKVDYTFQAQSATE